MSEQQGVSGGPNDHHPLLGALRATFNLEAGLDLANPAMPEWADLIDETIGPEKKP